jgi:hypothetical protein
MLLEVLEHRCNNDLFFKGAGSRLVRITQARNDGGLNTDSREARRGQIFTFVLKLELIR